MLATFSEVLRVELGEKHQDGNIVQFLTMQCQSPFRLHRISAAAA
jgi:hypothetical protein